MRTKALSLFFACLIATLLAACQEAKPTLLPPEPDDTPTRDDVQIDAAQLVQLESWPVQVRLQVQGSLPSPCHKLEWTVDQPDSRGVIEVEAIAVSDGGAPCAAVTQSFEDSIPIGSFSEGSYSVSLNGRNVGGFGFTGESPADQPGQERGPVFIEEAVLIVKESFPVQVELNLRGSLPTPCASLRWSAAAPDAQGRINVEAYSVQDPNFACIQVLEAFEESLPLGSYSEGSYSVWLNGELVGEFQP